MDGIELEDNQLNPAQRTLMPCRICCRNFNSASLMKHTNICEKIAGKKRTPFDSARQRREGIQFANFSKNSIMEKPNLELTPPKLFAKQRSQWHLSGSSSEERVPAASNEPHLGANPKVNIFGRSNRSVPSSAIEKCPRCERIFGLRAYDRHVGWCKEKSSQAATKISSDEKHSKETLATRRKYRPMLRRRLNASDERPPMYQLAACSSSPSKSNLKTTGKRSIEEKTDSDSSLELFRKRRYWNAEETLKMQQRDNALSKIQATLKNELSKQSNRQGTPRPTQQQVEQARMVVGNEGCQSAQPLASHRNLFGTLTNTSSALFPVFNFTPAVNASTNPYQMTSNAFLAPRQIDYFPTSMVYPQQRLFQNPYRDLMDDFRMKRRMRDEQKKNQPVVFPFSCTCTSTPVKAFPMECNQRKADSLILTSTPKSSPTLELELDDTIENADLSAWNEQQNNTLDSTETSWASCRESLGNIDSTNSDDYFSARSDDSFLQLSAADGHESAGNDSLDDVDASLLIEKSTSVSDGVNGDGNGTKCQNANNTNNDDSENKLINMAQHSLSLNDSDELGSSDSQPSYGRGSKCSYDSAFGSLSIHAKSTPNQNLPKETHGTNPSAGFNKQQPSTFMRQQPLLLQQQRPQQQFQMFPPTSVCAPNNFLFPHHQQQQHPPILQLYYNNAGGLIFGSPLTAPPGAVRVGRGQRFCYDCGTEFRLSHAKFCINCGAERLWI